MNQPLDWSANVYNSCFRLLCWELGGFLILWVSVWHSNPETQRTPTPTKVAMFSHWCWLQEASSDCLWNFLPLCHCLQVKTLLTTLSSSSSSSSSSPSSSPPLSPDSCWRSWPSCQWWWTSPPTSSTGALLYSGECHHHCHHNLDDVLKGMMRVSSSLKLGRPPTLWELSDTARPEELSA